MPVPPRTISLFRWLKRPSISTFSVTKLVGLEPDLAHALAVELGLRLELLVVGRDAREQALASGACDVAAGRIKLDRAMVMQFSGPIAEERWAFLVPDHKRELFASLVRAQRAFTLPEGDEDLLQLVNAWLEQAKASGLLEAKLDYWVRGMGARAEEGPRWSIARDVVGWWKDWGVRIREPLVSGRPKVEKLVWRRHGSGVPHAAIRETLRSE